MSRMRFMTFAAPLVLAATAACVDDKKTPTLVVPLDAINEVSVYVFGERVQEGDTIRIRAEGFRDGNGLGVQLPTSVKFTSDDTTIFRVVSIGGVGTIQPYAMVRGVRPGLARVSATLNGVTGSDTLRVIARVP